LEELHFLHEFALISLIAVVVAVVLSKFKLPTVAGLLAAGALLGPYGFQAIHSIHSIEVLAEMGVIFLLFSIGLEFSLSRLKHIFKQVLIGGLLQVGLTIAFSTMIAMFLGQSLGKSIFYGFVISLSSTAIVLKALGERRELDAPHGKFIVGTLIFQDLCVVPMVLIVPLLGDQNHGGNALVDISLAMLKAGAVMVALISIAGLIVPKLLDIVDASRSREVFILAMLGICIGTAWLTSLAGLSLALGAFLGGMVIADTEYGHRAIGDILPLRDTFVSVFFVSLGMMFNIEIVWEHPILVSLLMIWFLFFKGMIATFSAMAMKFPARAAWLAGVGLAQFGEFGFVLTKLAQKNQLVTQAEVAPLLNAGIITMFLTPLLVRIAPHITAGEKLLTPLEKLIGVKGVAQVDEPGQPEWKNHVVIIGFGPAGRFAAKALLECQQSFLILELNAESVRKGKEQGFPIYYGDATSEEALRHAHVDQAKLVLLLLNDPQAAMRIVKTIQQISAQIEILMRVRFMGEQEMISKLGVKEIVIEELEGSVETIAKMLRSLNLPRNVIDHQVRQIRQNTILSDRKQTIPRNQVAILNEGEELKIESLMVYSGSKAIGQSPISLKLRSETGVLVVAVKRDQQIISHIDDRCIFQAQDIVYLIANNHSIEKAMPYFSM
jgi:CPA2 family monovalent cation:H+ antiporter-2